MNQGWECPRCHRCWAPKVKKCKECKPVVAQSPAPYTPWIIPYTPYWVPYTTPALPTWGPIEITCTSTTSPEEIKYTVWNDSDPSVYIGSIGI